MEEGRVLDYSANQQSAIIKNNNVNEVFVLDENRLTARTWAEVNLGAIAHNIQQTRLRIGKDVRLMAVVKANAYGHGAIEVARVARKAGADALGVATLEEALELRHDGKLDVPILVLGYTPAQEASVAAMSRITLTIVSPEHAKAVQSEMARFAGGSSADENNGSSNTSDDGSDKRSIPTLLVHLKIDTGMGRLGVTSLTELDSMVNALSGSNVRIEGAFTHFAQADASDKKHANLQLGLVKTYFERLASRLNRQDLIFHSSNSAAIIDMHDSYFSMVRLGISLYGVYPSDDVEKGNLPLRQAMHLFTRVAHVKEVESGTTISYGSTFVTDRRMKIATLPIGYADGLLRILSNRGFMLLKGQRCKVIGRICMDQTMIDVSAVPDVHVDDIVTVFDEQTLPLLSKLAETIPYELLCAVSRRVPRVYRGEETLV